MLGYVAFVYALQHLPVAKVSLYGYVNPIVAVIVGVLAAKVSQPQSFSARSPSPARAGPTLPNGLA